MVLFSDRKLYSNKSLWDSTQYVRFLPFITFALVFISLLRLPLKSGNTNTSDSSDNNKIALEKKFMKIIITQNGEKRKQKCWTVGEIMIMTKHEFVNAISIIIYRKSRSIIQQPIVLVGVFQKYESLEIVILNRITCKGRGKFMKTQIKCPKIKVYVCVRGCVFIIIIIRVSV